MQRLKTVMLRQTCCAEQARLLQVFVVNLLMETEAQKCNGSKIVSQKYTRENARSLSISISKA